MAERRKEIELQEDVENQGEAIIEATVSVSTRRKSPTSTTRLKKRTSSTENTFSPRRERKIITS